jgi:FkbM family methyltransferase
MLKQLVKDSIRGIARGTARILPQLPGGEYTLQQLVEAGMDEHCHAHHNSVHLTFVAPNALCRYRAKSFSTKEPDTLRWIDEMPANSVVWDIGANVGLYSIYAAKSRHCRVFAFEPSAFNLELLARNIFLNGVQDRVVIVPVALSDALGPSLFKMSSTARGGALSTFAKDFDQHGDILKFIFEYQTMGLTMDEAYRLLKIPAPRSIKIDVDGIEHFILRGGTETLKGVDTVMIEIDDGFAEQAEETARHLQNAGLRLLRKCGGNAGSQYNQWWVRGCA